MPEGPEIRHHAQKLRPMIGKQLTSVHVLSGRYIKKSIVNMSKPVGQVVRDITVKGKLIGIHFDNCVILSTAGMSGQWINDDRDHKFKRIELIVGNVKYHFLDQRNFGTFKVVSTQEALEKFESLGPDIFVEYPPEDLHARIARFGGSQLLCEALLDQRIFCGVGNYIRAEAMYLASFDPRVPITKMTKGQVELVWAAAHEVALNAFEQEHNYRDLCYRREVAENGKRTRSFTDRNGRTVWYVPTYA